MQLKVYQGFGFSAGGDNWVVVPNVSREEDPYKAILVFRQRGNSWEIIANKPKEELGTGEQNIAMLLGKQTVANYFRFEFVPGEIEITKKGKKYTVAAKSGNCFAQVLGNRVANGFEGAGQVEVEANTEFGSLVSESNFYGLVNTNLRVSTRGRKGVTELDYIGPGNKPKAKPKTVKAPIVRNQYVRPNGETYHSRDFTGHNDVEAVRKAHELEMSTLLYGPPGTGKTALIEAAFTQDGEAQFYSISGSSDTEVSDFVGSYIPMPGGGFDWVDGPLVKAMEEGKALFIDEIALIDPKVLSVVYSTMDGRKELIITSNPGREGGNIVHAQDGFGIHGACNPNAPGARMSEALLSRFDVQREYTTDYDLARNTLKVDGKAVTAAKNIDVKRKGGECGWSPQMRELLTYQKVKDAFGEMFALVNMVSSAPEIDRDVVQTSLESTFGVKITI